MSLLSNLLAFSSLVLLFIFRTISQKSNSDQLQLAIAFYLSLMITTKLLNLSRELYQKVYLKWDCYLTQVNQRSILNIDVFIELSIILVWRFVNNIMAFLWLCKQ